MRKALQQRDRLYGRRNAWLRFKRRRRTSKGTRWPANLRSPATRKPRYVTVWEGGETETAICLGRATPPPTPLCFTRNLEASVSFFDELRRFSSDAIRRNEPFLIRTENQYPRIVGFYDFSRLSDISTAAAVVLASEYERVAQLQNLIPPTVNLHEWHEPVFDKLFELGFFEIVRLWNVGREVIQGSGLTRTMRIVSSKSADELHVIDAALQELGRFLRPDDNLPEQLIIEFLTVISEAISNVTAHAYADPSLINYRHIDAVWVAATADKRDDTLTIVVYDQGATIPTTYPRLGRTERVLKFLKRATRTRPEKNAFADDGTYIRAAMRYGGSRTDKTYRGKGLPQMFDVLKRMKVGTMTILSRGGWCVRDGGTGRIRSGALNNSIGGTLVEWRVALS